MDYLNKKILLIFQFNFSSLPNLAHCDFVTFPSETTSSPLIYLRDIPSGSFAIYFITRFLDDRISFA